MENEENHIASKEAKEALDAIKEMENAGLKRVLPVPIWYGAILALLIGAQIALLGAEIRTHNTLNTVLIMIMAIAIINKNRSAGVIERIFVSNRVIILSIICIIAAYFLLIIAGQYLKVTFGYNWAPFAIGVLVVLGFWTMVLKARDAYFAKFNDGSK